MGPPSSEVPSATENAPSYSPAIVVDGVRLLLPEYRPSTYVRVCWRACLLPGCGVQPQSNGARLKCKRPLSLANCVPNVDVIIFWNIKTHPPSHVPHNSWPMASWMCRPSKGRALPFRYFEKERISCATLLRFWPRCRAVRDVMPRVPPGEPAVMALSWPCDLGTSRAAS